MKKRICYILLTLCMVVLLLPCVVLAADDPITNTEAELRTALTDGGTVTLGSDITITSTLEINGTVTLDLNGYTLTYESETDGSVIKVNSGANLTLEDNSEDKTGTITGGHAGVGKYGGGVLVSMNAVFTMKGGTISNCTAWGGGGVYSCGSFTMTR